STRRRVPAMLAAISSGGGSLMPMTGTRRRFLEGSAAVATAASARPVRAAETPPSASAPELAVTLARYAAALKYEDLPPDIVRIVKRTILDTVGCAFGGYAAQPSRIALKLAGEVSAKHAATVLCGGFPTNPDLAVFANGVMIRYLDFNDAFV